MAQGLGTPASQVPVSPAQGPGEHEAMRMVRARAVLSQNLEAKKVVQGLPVHATLMSRVRLENGTELPAGTLIMGTVTQDEMHSQGLSTLALRFDQAHLKSGEVVPIKATIVGFSNAAPPSSGYPNTGEQVPSTWNDGTLQIDQIGVMPGVDLHSRISGHNSGVFVSTKNDDMKLAQGSVLEFAMAALTPGQQRRQQENSETQPQ